MVKFLWLIFVALLVLAHSLDPEGSAYDRPLSMFRDSQPAWVGYALFGVLIAIGAGAVRTALRAGGVSETLVYAAATAMLLIAAATPSYGGLHNLCAFVSMLMMYLFYAAVLSGSERFWLLAIHLVTPILILAATRVESYGIWQKAMILYFASATMLHDRLLTKWGPDPNLPSLELLRLVQAPARRKRTRPKRPRGSGIRPVAVRYIAQEDANTRSIHRPQQR